MLNYMKCYHFECSYPCMPYAGARMYDYTHNFMRTLIILHATNWMIGQLAMVRQRGSVDN